MFQTHFSLLFYLTDFMPKVPLLCQGTTKVPVHNVLTLHMFTLHVNLSDTFTVLKSLTQRMC